MNRLLQGDVGSGKTIVALLAALVAMENGLQVAVHGADGDPGRAAPRRHPGRLLAATRFRVGPADRRDAGGRAPRQCWPRLAAGDVHLVVGTHALVQEDVAFRRLGLVSSTSSTGSAWCSAPRCARRGSRPDVLVMTATPIPRTLALTHLRRSRRVGDPRPAARARQPVKTMVEPETRRDRGVRVSSGSSSSAAARATSSIRSSRSRRRSTSRPRPRWPITWRRRSSRRTAWPAARPDDAGRQGPRHAAFAARRDRPAGLHDGRRGRHRRAERVGHGGRARRALRPVAAPSAPRAGGARRHQSYCVLLYQEPLSRTRPGAAEGDGRDRPTAS